MRSTQCKYQESNHASQFLFKFVVEGVPPDQAGGKAKEHIARWEPAGAISKGPIPKIEHAYCVRTILNENDIE